jgi:hypothetical protein
VHSAENESRPEDPVPDAVVEQAVAAFGTRRSGELAVLAFDSLIDNGASPEDHELRFEHDRLHLSVRVTVGEAGTALSGSVAPATAGRFELRSPDSDVTFLCPSDNGTFTFGPLGHGLFKVSFEPASAAAVATEWFRI